MKKKHSQVLFSLLSIILCLVIGCDAAESSNAVKLRVSEGFENPIGFYDARPVFSWQLPQDTDVQRQTAYRIVAAGDINQLPDTPDLWDSGIVKSDQSVYIPYAGKPLQSRQRVYWQVQYWDQQGRQSAWSKPAYFELGLLNNSDWKGRWIRKQIENETRSDSPKIEIVKAIYGVLDDPEKQVDLTGKLRRQVKTGNLSVEASNGFAGGDPAYGTPKSLLLEYRQSGKLTRKTLKENASINLVTGQAEQAAKALFVPEYLRKTFAVESPVQSARLHVTAKGLYEVYLNGNRVGDDYMAPGWTPYDKRIETLTYDVTDHLVQGDNIFGAILGEGWYAGELMRKKAQYPQIRPVLLLQLEITGADGTVQTIVTDKSWKATNNGPIRYSSIYHGETYDGRMEMPGWNKADFDDSRWSAVYAEPVTNDVPLVPKRHYPVRITQTLPTQTITEPAPGKFVFDLGQNMVGWPKLKIPVEKDKTITVRVAEMLEKDGTLYTKNYRSAKSTDYYTGAKNGTVTWHPVFTFHGYRYVELSGFPEGTAPKTDWVTGMVLHSDFDQSGRFTSSHAKLNQLQRNITWGQRGNYLDVPTDCPQRNERLGWTGDAQVFCPTSLFNYDVHSFWASWLESVRQDQNDAGLIPHVVPDVLGGFGSPGWGDVGVVSPWDVYVRTGDREILQDNYRMMCKWTDAYANDATDYITPRKGFGDWLQPYPAGTGNRADTPMDLIATAYFGRCAAIMVETANVLGKPDDAEKYQQMFNKVRTAFSNKYFDKNGKLTTKIPTQTAYLMALGFDLLPEDLRDGAVKNLLALIEDAGGHLRTGFLGTPLITFVLDDYGHTDAACQVLFKETYPSWFYSINQGATTMWERWNSYSHKDGFGNAGMNSFNHYAYGAVGQWMYERIAGLAPDPAHPGYKHFFIQPRSCGPLTMAQAELQTPYGKAASGWRLSGQSMTVNATVPPNTTATLIVPKQFGANLNVTESGTPCKLIQKDGRAMYELKPGQYTFEIQSE